MKKLSLPVLLIVAIFAASCGNEPHSSYSLPGEFDFKLPEPNILADEQDKFGTQKYIVANDPDEQQLQCYKNSIFNLDYASYKESVSNSFLKLSSGSKELCKEDAHSMTCEFNSTMNNILGKLGQMNAFMYIEEKNGKLYKETAISEILTFRTKVVQEIHPQFLYQQLEYTFNHTDHESKDNSYILKNKYAAVHVKNRGFVVFKGYKEVIDGDGKKFVFTYDNVRKENGIYRINAHFKDGDEKTFLFVQSDFELNKENKCVAR